MRKTTIFMPLTLAGVIIVMGFSVLDLSRQLTRSLEREKSLHSKIEEALISHKSIVTSFTTMKDLFNQCMAARRASLGLPPE